MSEFEQKGVKIYGGGHRIENDPIRLSSIPKENPNNDGVKAHDSATVVKKDEEGNVIAED